MTYLRVMNRADRCKYIVVLSQVLENEPVIGGVLLVRRKASQRTIHRGRNCVEVREHIIILRLSSFIPLVFISLSYCCTDIVLVAYAQTSRLSRRTHSEPLAP